MLQTLIHSMNACILGFYHAFPLYILAKLHLCDTCICVSLLSSQDDRSTSDGSRLSQFSLFSQTKVNHFSFYCVCIIFYYLYYAL